MIKAEAVGKIIELIEAYYGVKYRATVKDDVRDFLNDLQQGVAVSLFEIVKLDYSTQFKEPPSLAIFNYCLKHYESDVFGKLENNASGIRMKYLLPPQQSVIESKQEIITEEQQKEIDRELEKLKQKYS